MPLPREATLARIYVGERDRHGHRPLYEAIVLEARQHGLAGATALRGLIGYGSSSVLHTAKILELSEDLPIVVEIVDEETRISEFLDVLEPMLESALVTLEKVRVVHYGISAKND